MIEHITGKSRNDDINELKLHLDSLLFAEENERSSEIERELEELQARNDELLLENIKLKKQKRKLDIREKRIKSILRADQKKGAYQQKLRMNYMNAIGSTAPQATTHFIQSPTDKIMGNGDPSPLPMYNFGSKHIGLTATARLDSPISTKQKGIIFLYVRVWTSILSFLMMISFLQFQSCNESTSI